MKNVAVAQAMIDTAEKQIEEARMKLETTGSEQRVVEKRKQSFMNSFVAKKQRSPPVH